MMQVTFLLPPGYELGKSKHVQNQGRRIKMRCPAEVLTDTFHPTPLLVFSDSYFPLFLYHFSKLRVPFL